MRWQRLLVRSTQQEGLGWRSALAFGGKGACSRCLAFSGAAMKITLWSLRCWHDQVAWEGRARETQNYFSRYPVHVVRQYM